MKFLCLAYYDAAAFEQIPENELTAIVSQCPTHDAALKKSGHLLEIASLGEPRSAVTLRPRGGQTTVTDGPYMETNEQVGSFFLVEADDMVKAVRIASLHPAAQLGEQLGWGIDIRAVEFFENSKT